MTINTRFSWIFKFGCFSMLSFVAMGARYGHAGALEEDNVKLFQKAQLYHLANNMGFLSLSLVYSPNIASKIALGSFLLGTGIFVIPLYYMAVKGKNQYITKTMPLGGGSMLIGWGSLLFA